MSLSSSMQILNSSSCLSSGNTNHENATSHRGEVIREVLVLGFALQTISSRSSIYGICRLPFSQKRRVVDGRWRLHATDTSIVDTAVAKANTIDIPVTCYQLIGVSDQAEKDEVVKSVMNLKRSEIEDGYTRETVVSRQHLLMDVRDKLLFEPEYAGNIKQNIGPKCPLRVPWAWLPSALCLLQEVGEEKLVLSIGQTALQHPDAKPYTHDLLLSMALAECAIAKFGFEKNKVSQGFEALARAQRLLRSKASLGKMKLLSQIEESLEELAPACTLEVLGMPYLAENAERRQGAIAALRELLRQGLDVETSCEVQDWSCFLSQALKKLMAAEIVDLLPWDKTATIRKNKKSLESQNQRVVIDFNCFYLALIAHVALGYSRKEIELINKAKTICECLMASEGFDLKFEQALCLFLLGQGTEAEAIEKLKQLDSNLNSASRNSISGKEMLNTSENSSLEAWLQNAALILFPDTQDCSPSLANFFRGEKRDLGSKKRKGDPLITPVASNRSMSAPLMELQDFKDSLKALNSSRHLGSAVKPLAPTDLQNPLILGRSSKESNPSTPSVQLKRNLGLNDNEVWETLLSQANVVKKISFFTVSGFALFLTLKLFGMKLNNFRNISTWSYRKPSLDASSLAWKVDSPLSCEAHPPCIFGSGFTGQIKKLLKIAKTQMWSKSDTEYSPTSCLPAIRSTSMTTVYRNPMPTEEAEDLVQHWQATKAEALGPSHHVRRLSEALDEGMLAQWQSLADAARAKSCYWRFVLLHLTILQADILHDEIVGEIAEIDALLEEAAELVDKSQAKNSNYYSTYKVHYTLKKQDDGSWKICEGTIEMAK